MSHQPFEDWIIDADGLENKDRILLEEHIASCQECRKLSIGMDEVDRLLSYSKPVSAPSGFSERWKSRLEQRKIETYRNQSRLFFALLLLFLMILFTIWGLYWVPTVSLLDLLVITSKSTVILINIFGNYLGCIQTIIGLPIMSPILLSGAALVLIGIVFMTSVWLTLIWRYSIKGAA